MFCPKCGSILMPKKSDKRKRLMCSCGYSTTKIEAPKLSEEIKQKSKPLEVIERDDAESLPRIDAECPKCGHKKAFYWLVQTRAADEPETKFMRCEKCKHTWRDYS